MPHPTEVNLTEPSKSTPPFKPGEKYCDRLAGDSPGEELSNDATIWKIYLDEAGEYDEELVKGRHASLDVLLLFVRPHPLFSPPTMFFLTIPNSYCGIRLPYSRQS